MPHPSVDHTLEILQTRAPSSTFLALGQTVFWDEPVKASWRRVLDRQWPSAQLIAGIHDTDYFAKTTAHVADNDEFIALAHDDGATRGLWSAAGELSSLLGSEDLPTRAFYESLGISFDGLAGRDAGQRRQFFADFTSAYGWQGVVQTIGNSQIAGDVPLSKFGPALLGLLDWGFAQSVACLGEHTAQDGLEVAARIRGWVQSYVESCSDDCTLTDLYQYLLPKFYELLLDFEPSNFSVTCTTELLKFNPLTAKLPRFAFVNHFLDLKTRALAVDAYSKSVAGGGMYALDHFGPGAVPFDVVVPGVGRGTLHLGIESISINFAASPVTITTDQQVTSVEALASVLTAQLGDNVVLVGKAVSLVNMLASEFVLIFHETASGYTDRTTAMNDDLRSQGIELSLNPIVRISYHTWDSLSVVADSQLSLPAHLANSFKTGHSPINADVFAARWRDVVRTEQARLAELKNLVSLRALIGFLLAHGPDGKWSGRREELEHSRQEITSNFVRTSGLRQNIAEIRKAIAAVKDSRRELEALSGADYQRRLRPAQELAAVGDAFAAATVEKIMQDRTLKFDEEIYRASTLQRELKKKLKRALAEKKSAERTEVVLADRARLSEIDREANMAKLEMARDAYLTVHGLPHTNARPTSWWLPMVDPTGRWFDEITDTLEARLEEL